MNELACGGEMLVDFHFALDPVFNSLYIMVSCCFDGLDGFAVFDGETGNQTAQIEFVLFGEIFQFRKIELGKCDEPFDFDGDSGTHKCEFREDIAQGFSLASVAAVKRGNSG